MAVELPQNFEEQYKNLTPLLKKVFNFIVENECFADSINQIAEKMGVSASSIRRAVYELRKTKGINFYELVVSYSRYVLMNEYTPAIYYQLALKASKGNLRAIELYLKAIGDLREYWNVEYNANVKLEVSVLNALREARERLKSLPEPVLPAEIVEEEERKEEKQKA